MIGPTRPLRSIPLSGILAIAGTLATLSVLAIPAANVTSVATEPSSTAPTAAVTVDQERITRDGTANLRAVGEEVASVLNAVEAVAATAVN